MGKFSYFFANIKSPVRKIPFDQRREIIADITESSSPGFDYFLLVILSTSIATLGLITDSPAVIIGAMLVAPLMSPIIGIGLASMIGRRTLLKSAISALIRGALLAVALSALFTFINSYLPFVSLHELPQEIISRTHPSPIDLMIALAGGIAAAYSLTEERLSAALPGVAIATALMPPICTVGIGIAIQRWDVAGGAFLRSTGLGTKNLCLPVNCHTDSYCYRFTIIYYYADPHSITTQSTLLQERMKIISLS